MHFICLISLSYKKFILPLIKTLVLFSTPLVMLSTKNRDLMMNYVLTNNPKMLIQYSSSHSTSFYGRPSCLGLLFTLILSLLINVFVHLDQRSYFWVHEYQMIHCNSIVHIVAQNKWIRKNIRSFYTITNTKEHSNKQAIRLNPKCLRVNILWRFVGGSAYIWKQ